MFKVNGQGDLHVRIIVEVPTHLSAAQKAKLEEFADLCNGKESPIRQSFFDKAKNLFQKAGGNMQHRSPLLYGSAWHWRLL